MSNQEFILWLKGFTEGVHEYNITPKQWDLLKEKLATVQPSIGIAEPYTISYTTNGAPNWYSSNLIENDSREK
jgi:hypothetical protein